MREVKGDFSYAPEEVKDEWMDLMTDISNASLKVERKKWEHFRPDFLDTQSRNYDAQQVLKSMSERRILYQQSKIEQMEGHIKIKTDMPITVIPIGDIHLGSVYHNHELFQKHITTIMETPGVYVLFLGNEVDNAIPAKFPANLLANSIPPQEQFKIMQYYIKMLDKDNRVLGAVVSDCHQGWSWSVAGIDGHELLYGYKGRKFPVLENGGLLHLFVGKGRNVQDYNIGLWHKQGPFNSRFNPEHALRQNRRLYHESKTDAEIGAHYHNTTASASYEGTKTEMRPVHWIRVGTYKGVPFADEKDFITDKWISEKAGTSGQRPGTALHFWADRHEIDDSIDFDTAIEKHMAIRTYALIQEMGLEERFLKLLNIKR
ncbi:MAG: hypothetical protein UT24_C0029G0010 [Candidatus Woesebacteria bacterium GW2011_GWB1_39_12]|uniref:Calcineurin-like phosphoesterase domain-containing protein n=1 Tax=Candidatus Woesebacteria bacterium GW2011_GWB1_39_12 TaxID=1618574 RepID=A0A0G0M481_9BACT|nr:MAG: hypothetical protein UT24_C0029G0010 [Candidatus Woesebacteria bacterium GW2011_GWB1_39_12]